MENNTNQQKNNVENVLEKIQNNEIEVQSKLHFTVKAIALLFAIFGVLSISIFILNFILFSIRVNSQESLLVFGPKGFVAFVRFFPWELLVLDFALVIVLQWILRSFRFGYKTPVLYLFAGIFLLTLVIGAIFDRGTSFNDALLHRADQKILPSPFNQFYGRARMVSPGETGICRCKVVSINGNMLIVEDTREEPAMFTIELPLNDMRATTTMIHIGDLVLIAGEIRDNVIYAFGLRRVSPNGLEFAR